MRAHFRRRPLHSPLMWFPPYLRYLLWRALSPLVITVADGFRKLRLFHWRLFFRELLGLAFALAFIVVMILIIVVSEADQWPTI